jgi:hypothetical protein
MKVCITEKQLKLLLSKRIQEIELGEADEAPSSGDSSPKSGTSDKQSGGNGYPEVTTWSDTVGKELTRGVGNPIDDKTKWADDIKITRGPGNELKEQDVITHGVLNYVAKDIAKNDTPYVLGKTPWNTELKIPKTAVIKYFEPGSDRRKLVQDIKVIGDNVYWKNGTYNEKFKRYNYELSPSNDYLTELLPDNTVRYFKTDDGKEWVFYISRKGLQEYYFKYRNYYYNKEIYKEENYIKKSTSTSVLEFFSENGELILMVVGSLIITFLTGGIGELVLQSVWGLGFAVKEYTEGKKVGAAVTALLSLLPFSTVALKVGIKGPLNFMGKIGPELSKLETAEEVANYVNKLNPNEKVLFSRVLKLSESDVKKVFTESTILKISSGISEGTISLSKIPVTERAQFKKLLYNTVVGGGVMGGAVEAQTIISDNEMKDYVNAVEEECKNNPNGLYSPELKRKLEELSKKYQNNKN